MGLTEKQIKRTIKSRKLEDDNFIEAVPTMFHKRKPPIDLSNFGVEYEDTGINPIKHFKMIKFDYNITKILSETFKL